MNGFLRFCLAALLLVNHAAAAELTQFTCTAVLPGLRAASIFPLPPATGVKNILWTRLAFANETNQPAEEAEIQSGLQTANATLIRVSNTNVSLLWTITPVLQLPNPITYYSNRLGDLLTDGRTAAAAAGYDWESFDIQVFGPRPIPGWRTGVAPVPGNWLYCSSPAAGVIVHELGHCFGLWHANAWQARAPDFSTKTSPPFPSNFQTLTQSYSVNSNSVAAREGVMFPGQSIEYGDPFDIMGNVDTNSDFNMAEKLRLGWIPATNITTVTNVGFFRLTAQHALRLAPLIVGRHPDKAPRQYWIEPSAAGDGVYVRWADTNISRETLFIDATPGSRYWPLPTPFQDGLLKVGSTLEDAGLGLWITPTATNSTGENHSIDVTISRTRPSNLPTAPTSGNLLTGHVVDNFGNPLAGALIHNGRAPHEFYYASTFSDENGNYTLAMPAAGTYAPNISLYGYRLLSPAPNASVTIPGSMDFILEALPRVSVSAQGPSIFTVTRTGPVADPLQVDFQLTGNLELVDFEQLASEVTIPAGETSAQIMIPLRAIFTEGKSLTFHAIMLTQFERDGIIYYYPGWELRTLDSITNWFQTDPPYVTFADAEATISAAEANELRLAVAGIDRLNLFGPAGASYQIQLSTDLLSWSPVVNGTIQGSPALVTLPPPAGTEPRFYRALLLP